MKRTLLLTFLSLIVIVKAKSQVILNEIYTDPGAGKHEFFELYNTSGATTPMSLDDYTVVTFFEISGKRGFYVLDLPNLTINPQGFFVGSSTIPFDYQGITNSTESDFSWNDPALILNSGYMKKWQEGTVNLLDGNAGYDEQPLPANFNDFFYRRSGVGHSYCVFVYKNGQLVNTFIGGTGGKSTIISAIVTMPTLHIDMLNPLSTDFAIDWSIYASIPLEYCIQDAGSDNGFIRELDGACGMWDKSSAGVQHTPQKTNGGQVDETTGTISVSSVVVKGTAVSGSTVEYDVVAVADSTQFPVEMMVYIDNGTVPGLLDPADTYIESSIENALSEGPFTTTFFPHTANILIVVKSSAGCLDKIQFLPNTGTLAVNLSTFHGNVKDDMVMLGWTVMQNEAADRYVIEKSVDGKEFKSIATISASNKLGQETYGLNDRMKDAPKAFYRLRMIDKRQASEYSKILSFQVNGEISDAQIRVINNPVTDKLNVATQSLSNHPADLIIYDFSGRKIMNQKVAVYSGANLFTLPLNSSMKTGMYIVELTNGTQRFTSKFIKQ